mgnify:CR=1 FL=1
MLIKDQGDDSGLRHSHANTAAIQVQANQRSQRGVGVSCKAITQMAIMALALYLALRLTFPPWLQFTKIGPKRRWCHSQ